MMRRTRIETPETLDEAINNVALATRNLGMAIYFALPRPLRAVLVPRRLRKP